LPGYFWLSFVQDRFGVRRRQVRTLVSHLDVLLTWATTFGFQVGTGVSPVAPGDEALDSPLGVADNPWHGRGVPDLGITEPRTCIFTRNGAVYQELQFTTVCNKLAIPLARNRDWRVRKRSGDLPDGRSCHP